MSIPAHIWFYDESGSPIVGDCMMPTRLGSTELKSFNHSIWIPTDHNTGKLTGTRVHTPITLEKNIDRISPYLARAVCQGKTFKHAVIRMYKINEAGLEFEYYNIQIDNVKVTRVSPVLFPIGVASAHLEEIELRYEAISWKYVDGNIITQDRWNERATA